MREDGTDARLQGGQAGELREGFTTGACAAAAAKAAALALLAGQALPQVPPLNSVEIPFPDGKRHRLSVAWIRADGCGFEAAVIKDAGSDPDITHGATILVRLEKATGFQFEAGEGVGKVTRSGLQIPVGDCAINPGPRAMIRAAIEETGLTGARIRISIPGGERLAEKTFNPRLGVQGGLSILGTAGRVRPFSLEAITATIDLALNVAKEAKVKSLFLVPGHMGEKAARAHIEQTSPPEPFEIVEVSNAWDHALATCRKLDLDDLCLVGHPGKLAKLAQGHFDTHSSRSSSPLPWLLGLIPSLTRPQSDSAPGYNTPNCKLPDCEMLDCNTVEDAFQRLPAPLLKPLCEKIALEIQRSVRNHFGLHVTVLLSRMDGGLYS